MGNKTSVENKLNVIKRNILIATKKLEEKINQKSVRK